MGVARRLGVEWETDTDGDGFNDWVEEYRGANRLVADLGPAKMTVRTAVDRYHEAIDQVVGQRYQAGAPGAVDDPNPSPAIGQAALVKWAAGQVGVDLPDTGWELYDSVRDSLARTSIAAFSHRGQVDTPPADQGEPGLQVLLRPGPGRARTDRRRPHDGRRLRPRRCRPRRRPPTSPTPPTPATR